jgi:hypothetical protein
MGEDQMVTMMIIMLKMPPIKMPIIGMPMTV